MEDCQLTNSDQTCFIVLDACRLCGKKQSYDIRPIRCIIYTNGCYAEIFNGSLIVKSRTQNARFFFLFCVSFVCITYTVFLYVFISMQCTSCTELVCIGIPQLFDDRLQLFQENFCFDACHVLTHDTEIGMH